MTLRFLLLADNLQDVTVIQAMLVHSDLDYQLLRVGSYSDFETALSTNEFDLILADYALSPALEIACHLRPDVPFIFISGTLGEELAIAALQQGATDYVLKQRLERLVPAVQRALQLGKERRDRQLRERAREESAADLQAIFHLTDVGIAQKDVNNRRFIRVNAAFCHITGYTESELLTMTIDDLNHPDDRDRDRQLFVNLIAGAATDYQSEKRYIRKDGSIVWVLVSANVICDTKGQPLRTVAMIHDITERKQTEQALRNTEERLRVALQNAPITVFNQDSDLKYTWIHNPMLHQLQDMLGKCDRDFLSPAEAEALTAIKQRVLDTGIGAREEIKITKDGKNYYYDLTLEPLFDVKNTFPGITGAAINISELKQAEINWRESEERLRLAIESAQIGTWDVNLLTGKAIWSELHFTMLGYEPTPTGEATEAMWRSRIHPDDLERVIQEWQQSRQENRYYRSEYRVIRADNQQIAWMAALGSFQYDPNGKAVRSIGVLLEISDRKRRERNAEFLTTISRDLATSVNITDILANITHKIAFYLELSQLTCLEINEIGDRGRVIYGEDEGREYNLADNFTHSQIEHLQAGKVSAINNISSELIAPYISDRKLKFLLIGKPRFSSPWRTDEIELMQELAGRIWNRIERARAEENLRRSEEEFRTIANAAPALVWVCSPNGENLFFNDRWYEFTGQTESEAFGYGWASTMHPEDAVRILSDWERCQKTGATYEGEVRYRRYDGEYRWHAFRGLPRRDANGQIEAWYGLSIDITARIQAEAALRESERRLRRLVESNIFGVAITDFNGGIHYANDYFLKMLGYTRAEIETGQLRWSDITPTEFLPIDEQAAIELRTKGVATPFEKEYLRKDGTCVPILIGTTLFDEPYNQQPEIIAFYLDLTERKQAERERERLLVRERHYINQLQGLNTAALTINSALSVEEVLQIINTQAAAIIGAHQSVTSMTIGQNWEQSINTIYLSDKYAAWRDYDEQPDGSGIYAYVCRNNRPMRLTQAELEAHPKWKAFSSQAKNHPPLRGWLAVPLVGRDGKNMGLIQLSDKYEGEFTYNDEAILVQLAQMASIAAENAHLYEAEQQARAAADASREEAQAANRIKDEFLAVLSHELRSPLNPILGWAKLLQTQKFTPEKTAQGLATIERNAKLQAQLIEDLLDVSRILRGKLVLNICPVHLVSTIEAAIETVRLVAATNNIQILTQLDALVGTVSGDSARIQQIIWNLLTNAVKFTPPKGQVEVYLQRVDNFAQIQVKDTGRGINPEFLPFVFDYFRQEDGATTRKFGGLGLGLAIVRHLVELHGGTVQADSAGENLGATFTVRLPLMSSQPTVNIHSRLSELAIDLSGVQILVVDDATDSREFVATLLEQAGAIVFTAASAVEALTALRQSPPDILISDIGMPEIDGYMLVQQIRALPPKQGGNIPAIALTAYAGEIDQKQAIAAGFQRHISKPIEPQLLVRAIADLIQQFSA